MVQDTHSAPTAGATSAAAEPASRPAGGSVTPADVARSAPGGAPEPMTGAQSLIRSLEVAGTEVVFGIPGGTILPAYDPLMDSR